MRRRRPLFAAAAAVIVLAGCGIGPEQQFSDLDRAADDGKPLSSGLSAAFSSIDVESARWVGEFDGADVWIAADLETAGTCAIIAPTDDEESAIAGCGGSSSVTSGSGVPSVGIVADDQEPDNVPSRATRLSTNVWAWSAK